MLEDYSEEEYATFDMQAMGYRSEISDGIDELVEDLGGRSLLFIENDKGTYVNTEILYFLSRLLSSAGLEAVVAQEDKASVAYAHSATLLNVLAFRAEDRQPNDFEDMRLD